MANQWYFTRNGATSGPVSSRDLAAFAKDGHLLPTDLVWKEGMKEWLTALKVKGLFLTLVTPPGLPATTAVDFPRPPSPELAEPTGPSNPPPQTDLATAAKGLWSATVAAVKGAAAKAAETAKQLQEKATNEERKQGTSTLPPNPTGEIRGPLALHQQKRKLLIIGGIASVCVLVIIVAAISQSLFSRTNRASEQKEESPVNGTSDHRDRSRILSSFEDHPPPIIASIKEGKHVWILNNYHLHIGTGLGSHKEALYLVFTGKKLEYVVLKTHHTKLRSESLFGKKEETDAWDQYPAGESQSGLQSSITVNWKVEEKSEELINLLYTQKYDSTRDPDQIIASRHQSNISVRWNKGGTKASWEADLTSDTTLKKAGKTYPSHYDEHYQGFGQLLQ